MPKNYLEYNRPTPFSTDNGIRVTNGIGFGHREKRQPTRAQKRKSALKVTIIKATGETYNRRVTKAKACVATGLWNINPNIKNHKWRQHA